MGAPKGPHAEGNEEKIESAPKMDGDPCSELEGNRNEEVNSEADQLLGTSPVAL